MTLEDFKRLWFMSPSPTVWCEIYRHPLHRACPVVLNYEQLPEPFKSMAAEAEHEGKTGDTVQLNPERCYECPEMVLNGGVCDP
jgi:hypothetical protein